MSDTVSFGSYVCDRCSAMYFVNEPTSWRRCTLEFCHDCLEHLEKQSCVLPFPEPVQ